MNSFFKISCFFVLTYWSLFTFGQTSSINKKAQSAYENAAKQLALQNKSQAKEELKKAILLDPAFATAYQQLADIYRSEKRYKEAIPLYKKVLQINPDLTKLTLFGLGESQLAEGQYQEALINLTNYKTDNLPLKSREKVEKYIQNCEFAIRYNSKEDTQVTKLPPAINTLDDEYFPKLTADGKRIIFTRKSNNQENFFESNFSQEGWSTAEKISGSINSDFFNEGAHTISPDGKYLFFTGCNRPNGMGSCDIYVSKLERGTWSTPHNLGAPINTKGWEAQPAISSDGRTLYFVSNRPGGMGGSDIWKSELSADGKWQTPQNLGDKVNTAFDERAPYIHADNKTLYFASEGWPGFGQFDLFRTQLDSTGQWSTPTNLGRPINNNYDQTGIHVTMNGTLGYMASVDSTGQLDIYSLNMPKPMQPIPVVYIQGTIYDAENKKPLSAIISVTNTQNGDIVYLNDSDYEDGQFIATLPVGANYAVHVQKEGYMFDSKQYDISNTELKNEVFEGSVFLQPIRRGNTAQLNNIYFDTDSATPLKKSEAELLLLLKFLQLNSAVTIEIAGHTDNTGNKAHNQRLSENRASSIANFLRSKGIPASRVISTGYGDTKPIGDNATMDGKQRNRRTEVILR
ncbi:OmpA family protein [Sphingobacterium faecale]|uniref:PD40 domain-containing protein n=1 Tax=Sphingobacterium faecale TaxID=2803775 RepID=A0ABS1R265_9SPHI|nr:OmpA family protein [Sphingobacterium faecale]MBL1408785.1 PD40 domain-containing protein [Sphingobacterium faecale]